MVDESTRPLGREQGYRLPASSDISHSRLSRWDIICATGPPAGYLTHCQRTTCTHWPAHRAGFYAGPASIPGAYCVPSLRPYSDSKLTRAATQTNQRDHHRTEQCAVLARADAGRGPPAAPDERCTTHAAHSTHPT